MPIGWGTASVVQSLTIDAALTAQPSRGKTAAEASPKYDHIHHGVPVCRIDRMKIDCGLQTTYYGVPAY
jgi:hypothetical protein